MGLTQSQIEDVAVASQAMANAQRVTILCLLARQEMSVGQLNQHLDLSQSALSQHLSVLRHAHLVGVRREAQTIFYSVQSVLTLKVLAALDELFDPADY